MLTKVNDVLHRLVRSGVCLALAVQLASCATSTGSVAPASLGITAIGPGRSDPVILAHISDAIPVGDRIEMYDALAAVPERVRDNVTLFCKRSCVRQSSRHDSWRVARGTG